MKGARCSLFMAKLAASFATIVHSVNAQPGDAPTERSVYRVLDIGKPRVSTLRNDQIVWLLKITNTPYCAQRLSLLSFWPRDSYSRPLVAFWSNTAGSEIFSGTYPVSHKRLFASAVWLPSLAVFLTMQGPITAHKGSGYFIVQSGDGDISGGGTYTMKYKPRTPAVSFVRA